MVHLPGAIPRNDESTPVLDAMKPDGAGITMDGNDDDDNNGGSIVGYLFDVISSAVSGSKDPYDPENTLSNSIGVETLSDEEHQIRTTLNWIGIGFMFVGLTGIGWIVYSKYRSKKPYVQDKHED